MKQAKVICPICAYREKSPDETLTHCPRCNTDLTGSDPEQKVREAPGTYTAGKMGTNASIYLTDRRLLVVPEKLEGFNLTSVLTAAVVNKMTSKYGVVSVPLEQIWSVEEGKMGLLQKILIVVTADGEKIVLTLPKLKEWKEAIVNAAPNLN